MSETDTDFEPRFGIVVKHPLQDLALLVLGPQGRDATAMVLHDEAGIHPQWPIGHIETISCAGWIILDDGPYV